MGKRTVHNWELRLRLTQVLVLTGAVTGGMACSYYLGFFSGREIGVQLALANSAVNVARLPVIPPLQREEGEEDTSEVYAKLNAEKALDITPNSQGENGEEVPELTTIQTTAEGQPVVTHPQPEDTTSATPESPSFDPELVAKAAGGDPATLTPEPAEPKAGENKVVEPKAGETKPPEEKTKEVKKEEKKKEDKKEEKKEAKLEPKLTPPAKKEPEPGLRIDQKETNALPRGWFAQVAARQKEGEARQIAERLRSSGFPVVVESADVNGERYYRILVGPEDSKPTADRLVGQLKREPYIQGNPFVRAVR